MNKTLLLFRSDVRRLSSWLILWLLFLIIPVVLISTIQTDSNWNSQYWRTLVTTLGIITMAQFFIAAVLTIEIIQKESLTSPNAYWLPRPIPRGTLMERTTAGTHRHI